MHYTHVTKGTCSSMIDIELDGDVIKNIAFIGGCNGNTHGIAKLVQGMKAADVIALLEGTDCGGRGTSCPDQLAKGLRDALSKEAAGGRPRKGVRKGV